MRRNKRIAPNAVRLLPCSKACARETPDIKATAITRMSSSPYANRFCERAMALSRRPGSRTKWCSPVCANSARLSFMTASIGSQRGSLGKAGSDFWKPRQMLADEFAEIDLTLRRPGAQNLVARGRILCALEFGRLLVLEARYPLPIGFVRHRYHH